VLVEESKENRHGFDLRRTTHTSMNGAFGQKCWISGIHLSMTFWNDRRETTEKQITVLVEWLCNDEIDR
jgi:hypothetical protein